MSLEFSLDLAVGLYPTGSGEPLEGTNSSAFTTAIITSVSSHTVATLGQSFTAQKRFPLAEISLWSDVDRKLHQGSLPLGLFWQRTWDKVSTP